MFMGAMTDPPTFEESWLTGEIPHHPTLGSALLNAVLRAREVLTGQQEKTVRARWDALHTVLEQRRNQESTSPSLRESLAASLRGGRASYYLFCKLAYHQDPAIRRILDEAPREEVLAILVLGEVAHGNVHTALEAASELDPIRKTLTHPYGSRIDNYITRNIAAMVLELERQTKTIVRKDMGRKGGSSSKRGEGPVKHAIRRVSREIDSTKPSEVFDAFADAERMADLEESLSDPIRLTVLEVDHEKKEIHYRLPDGKEGKITYHNLQNRLSEINSETKSR